MTRILRVSFALVLLLTTTQFALGQDLNTTDANHKTAVIADPLVRMLVAKGVLTESEGHLISESGNVAEQRDRLANLLRDKGIISSAEYESIRTGVPVGDTVALGAKSNVEVANKTEREQPLTPQPAQTPSVIAAVAPTRLLPIDLPKREVQPRKRQFNQAVSIGLGSCFLWQHFRGCRLLQSKKFAKETSF